MVAETPLRNLIAFRDQPGRIDESFNRNGLGPFGEPNFYPRPSTVPATAQAVKFQGLWFWGWNP